MSDLIDRQAAIEIAIEAADEWDGGTSFSRDGIIERRLKMIPAVHIADVGKKVERTAVSAQNTSSCAHENDVISLKMAIEALARKSIEILPAVQPEIIHCKDCKHWRDDHTCHEHSLVSPMCANEYCSRAERRTDERFDRQTGGD